jgi:hypothetical protein
MYYKNSPYGQTSYPQEASYSQGASYPQGASYEEAPRLHTQSRTPLLPHGYTVGMMDTIKEYLSTPWIIAVALLVLVVIIVAIMISKKEGYY